MPIYEFRCSRCGERFEDLVAAGTARADCPACESSGAQRVLSPHAAPARLVKTPVEARRQERRNANLRERTNAEFRARAGTRRASGAGGERDGS